MMRTHFYNLRSDRLWWARIWVTSDGLITIASDHGNFGYWFGDPGGEIRRFLTRCDPSPTGYMAIKLSDGRRDYDSAATLEGIKTEIIQRRREGDFDRAAAREEWNRLAEHSNLDSVVDFSDWWREANGPIREAYTYYREALPNDVRNFMRDIWPVFVETLKTELQSEGEHREAFGEMQDMGT